MKISVLPVLAFALTLAAANPIAAPEPIADGDYPEPYSGIEEAPAKVLEKRDHTITVNVSALKHRSCPKLSCTAHGQYARGTKVTIKCCVRGDKVSGHGSYNIWGRTRKPHNNHYIFMGMVKGWKQGDLPWC